MYKLIIYGLAFLLAMSFGWMLSSHFRKPCPVCPPTTSNNVVIDKIKRGSVGNLSQAIGFIRVDTVYLPCDSVYKQLPARLQRRIDRRLNKH